MKESKKIRYKRSLEEALDGELKAAMRLFPAGFFIGSQNTFSESFISENEEEESGDRKIPIGPFKQCGLKMKEFKRFAEKKE